MKKLGKRAFIFKIVGFIVFVIVIVLLVFLIQNEGNISATINESIEFTSKLKERVPS